MAPKRHVRDIEWLRDRVIVDPTSGCWVWQNTCNHRGYGLYHYTTDAGVFTGVASRLALEFALGRPLLPGMNACHRCDNPPCCNGSHLFEGTTDDNQRDCREKGRARWRAGESHGMAKLKDTDIPKILTALAGGEPQWAIGKRFGVGQPTISRIKKYHGWRRSEAKVE